MEDTRGPGAQANGLREKDLVLEIGLELRVILLMNIEMSRCG